jgi:hypothetical protein
MISTSKAGEQVINYSERFSFVSMSGSLPANIVSGISNLPAGTTAGPRPSALESNLPSSDSEPTTIESYADPYMVPYAMQTGPTRYAPMQPVAGTKITAKSASRAYPTSSAVVATTLLPPAVDWQTTLTQSQTFSVSSRGNTVRD